MLVTKARVASAALALFILSAGAGIAAADGVHVVVPAPFFFPQADFHYDDGYYRTNEGHYYHYDRDRDGWHYGRNHAEGQRYEKRHGHR
jgi:hypothetical protein